MKHMTYLSLKFMLHQRNEKWQWTKPSDFDWRFWTGELAPQAVYLHEPTNINVTTVDKNAL